uniref:Uncharacterized protein n=1 Tax=Arundo donax TaxID=35708 RepID=A0A0A9B7H5_ARUDO
MLDLFSAVELTCLMELQLCDENLLQLCNENLLQLCDEFANVEVI